MKLETHGASVTFDVLVQPRTSRVKLGPVHDGGLKIAVTAAPVAGEANAAVIEAIAKQLDVPRPTIAVIAGQSSRRKTIRIANRREPARRDRGARVTRAVLLACLVACNGAVGTLSVTLATAPGSHVLDGAQTLRLVIANPRQVTSAHRGSSGFSIVVDVPATGAASTLYVDALDASDQVIASGASPPFPVGALDAKVVIYMAAPNTIGAAPTNLTPARSELGIGVLPYGAIFVGGRDAAGGASDAIEIYNTFDHSLITGKPLPAPRAGAIVAPASSGNVYVFGGHDAAGATTSNLWRFDTTVAPSGAYQDLGDKPGFARADQISIALGGDRFLLTGTPGALLSGGAIAARTEVTALPSAGVTLTASDGVVTTLLAGMEVGGFARFRNNVLKAQIEPAAARTNHAVVALPSGKVVVVCGGAAFPTALRIDAATMAVETFALPATSRASCAAAATSRHLLIAGGTLDDGKLATTAELYDPRTLSLVATLPLIVPRTRATAIALPNDQIMIVGGVDAAGAPIATIELFTPASLE